MNQISRLDNRRRRTVHRRLLKGLDKSDPGLPVLIARHAIARRASTLEIGAFCADRLNDFERVPDRMKSQETQKALGHKGLERSGKIQRNLARLHQYPLGESNQPQLSVLVPNTYDNLDMPGGAKSGALADEFAPNSQSPETFTGNLLLDAIRVLTDMSPDERAALIELLKTWG